MLAFRSYMTGEAYAVLRKHSILGRLAREPADAFEESAFRRGVERGLAQGAAGELLHRIFGARTLALFDELAPEAVADYLSGMLIGSEARAGCAWARSEGGHDVDDLAIDALVVGAPALTQRYAIALDMAGARARTGPADAAAHGIHRIACAAGLLRR